MQLFDGIKRLVYPRCTAHTISKKMEDTFLGNNSNIIHDNFKGYYVSEQCIMNMLGQEVWKPLLEEILKIELTPIVMVTISPKHTMSRNREATLREKPKTIVYPSCLSVATHTI